MKNRKVYIVYIAFLVALLAADFARGFASGRELLFLSMADEALRNNSFLHLTHHGEPVSTFFHLPVWVMILGKELFSYHNKLFLSLLSILPAIGILELSRREINKSCLTDEWKSSVFFSLATLYSLLCVVFAFQDALFFALFPLLLYHFTPTSSKLARSAFILLCILCAIAGGLPSILCMLPWMLLLRCNSQHIRFIKPGYLVLSLSMGLAAAFPVFHMVTTKHADSIAFLENFSGKEEVNSVFLWVWIIFILQVFFNSYIVNRAVHNIHHAIRMVFFALLLSFLCNFSLIQLFSPAWSYDKLGLAMNKLTQQKGSYRIYAYGVDQAEDLDVYINAPVMILEKESDLLAINPNSTLLYTKETKDQLSAFLLNNRSRIYGDIFMTYLP